MQIPETPTVLQDLDLMKRLRLYSMGEATWRGDGIVIGMQEQKACAELHANLSSIVERCLHPLMDRVTSREMQGFTMHDRMHGIKVAHLMWHILSDQVREALSPGEIALLVTSAHLHDLGMGLSDDERRSRLSSSSDLWEKIDPQSGYLKALSHLNEIAESGAPDEATSEAIYQIQQAQEALLCTDCRERHATRVRYQELLSALSALYQTDPVNLINPLTALSFDGDSFSQKLIEICVSHNEDAHVLNDPDPTNIDQPRFPTRYPIGCCTANTRMVAAALRLADILDFDRDRTPPILFHYLLPSSADPRENISVREWSKHLAISNWQIERDRIVFRGRSPSAFIHHVIVEFCISIQDEISKCRSIFLEQDWPFVLSSIVISEIETMGYRYIPYRFSLDEQRIYDLLMGRNIYRNRLDSIRELIQNSVDACQLRDALVLSHDSTVVPSKRNRVTIRYEEPTAELHVPRLSVIDTGVGMDRYIIENFFLKIGRSYYKSSGFLQIRSLLRKRGLDFSPVAEFGIGVMSIFMLGDRVEIETAPWSPGDLDSQRRILTIDGVGRLIEVKEFPNSGASRFYGTRVSVKLASRVEGAPTWDEIKFYVEAVCRNLPVSIRMEHFTSMGLDSFEIEAEGLKVPVPPHLADSAVHIPVDDADAGVRGEIVIYRGPEGRTAEAQLAAQEPLDIGETGERIRQMRGEGVLLRGGFAVGAVPGLPEFILTPNADARIEVVRDKRNPTSLPVTDLGRSRLNEHQDIANAVFQTWLSALLDDIDEIERRPIGAPDISNDLLRSARWLDRYDAFELYRLAKAGWPDSFQKPSEIPERIRGWERGQGTPLWCGDGYSRALHVSLLGMVLPKVTSIVVRANAKYYARPLESGWQETLKSWKTCAEDSLRWPDCAEYLDDISLDLYNVYGARNYFNNRYIDKMTGFNNDERDRMHSLFDRLIKARSRGVQIKMTRDDMSILERLAQVASNATVSYIGERYTIGELARTRPAI